MCGLKASVSGKGRRRGSAESGKGRLLGSQHNSFELLSAVAAAASAAAAVGTASVANFMAFTNTITLTRPAKIVCWLLFLVLWH